MLFCVVLCCVVCVLIVAIVFVLLWCVGYDLLCCVLLSFDEICCCGAFVFIWVGSVWFGLQCFDL